jgi:hypothetical protein
MCKNYIHDTVDSYFILNDPATIHSIVLFIKECVNACTDKYAMKIPELFIFFSNYGNIPDKLIELINQNPFYSYYLDECVSKCIDKTLYIGKSKRLISKIFAMILVSLDDVHESHDD